MEINKLNIYNNLVKLTRNKNLYFNLKNQDTFSDRLIIFFFHFAFFLKTYKSELSKNDAQEIFDYIIRQIELSIREIGYGDVSVNKKMKDYINLFYSILNNIEQWDNLKISQKIKLLSEFINIKDDNQSIVEYIDKYSQFLLKNSLKNFTKDILEFKF